MGNFVPSRILSLSQTPTGQDKDKKLELEGWTVIHFWGKDILKNPDECVRVIEETIFDMNMAEIDYGDEYELHDRL